MSTVIALVGRPNVGKSTLFNQLTRSRDAIVADFPGLTRDRQYGFGKLGGRYLVIDTGGVGEESAQIDELMSAQTWQGIEEADRVVWLLDARAGLTPGDEAIAERLRRAGKPVFLAVNKTDGLDAEQALAEFHGLGFSTPLPIAAAHGRGLLKLMEVVLADSDALDPATTPDEEERAGIRIAFVGRPNVGKSTLLNRMLGEQRVVVSDLPGTTRDSIAVPFERDGQRYTLIDTAGVRRRGRVKETVEKFSIVKTLASIDAADVVLHLIDSQEGITDQDVSLIGLSVNAGKSVIVCLNKWDGLGEQQRKQLKQDYGRRLAFLDFAEHFTISALHGTGVGLLFDAVRRAWRSATVDISTTRMTQLLEMAVARHQPPLVRGRRIKLRYAHQGGRRPPVIVIHGNQTEQVPAAYKRYLENFFRKQLKLVGTPIRLEFKTTKNPYAGRKPRKPASGAPSRREHRRRRR